MIEITFNAGIVTGLNNEFGRTFFLKEKFEEETVGNAIWYFDRVVKMLGVDCSDTLYDENMSICLFAETDNSAVELEYGIDEDISVSEIIWEFANALTYTDSQCDDIVNAIFNEED